MSIVLIRIDDRLIHGQVIEGWLKTIRVDRILVASDEVAKDELQKQLMAIAIPEDVKLTITGIDDSVKIINDGHSTKERILVLVPDIQSVLRMAEQNVDIESVNLGGLHWSEGKKQYLKSVSLDEQDIGHLEEIKKKGIEIEARALPMDDRIDILKLIEEQSGKK
ncbi:MAG: PTS sugar transporter subunit IIB [Elusimicrobiota bacterium]